MVAFCVAFPRLGTAPSEVVLTARFRQWKRDRKALAAIKGCGEKTIAELVDGERARVRGRVRRVDSVLRGPLSGIPCVWFEIRQNGLLVDEMGVDFVIEDEDGRAVKIEAKKAYTVLEAGKRFAHHGHYGLDKRIPLDEHAPCHEAIIKQGDYVTICGVALEEEIPRPPSYRERKIDRELRFVFRTDRQKKRVLFVTNRE